jgi:acyl-CoA oxidase
LDGFYLHNGVFIPNIEGLGDDEQRAYWLPLAKTYQVIGCYAQTELGHGSNVQGLETTATFVKDADEFDLHSPTLSSTKWWPGALGATATHAVVYARLIIDGKDVGIHSFIAQIRSLDNHAAMPGVTVGDIGPKYGGLGNDNGFLRFDHCRIPRRNMLMKFSKVDRNGNYSKSPFEKVVYGTMMKVRSEIVYVASETLSVAATIAVRYSCVRKQFAPPGGGAEMAVLDYSVQQYRLLPIVAAAYAIRFTGAAMYAQYLDLAQRVARHDFTPLAEGHCSSACLKSYVTRLVADGIEEARKCCGGHGYLHAAGLAQLSADYLQMCTAEGDNYVLTQQVARYLIKSLAASMAGEALAPSVRYLANSAAIADATLGSEDLFTPKGYVRALQHRAARLVRDVAMRVGSRAFEDWNAALVDIARMSRAHGVLLVVSNFAATVDALHASAPVLSVLSRLLNLFAAHAIEADLADFLESGYFSPQVAAAVRSRVRELLGELRPDAVALVEAFAHSDFTLNSAIGRADGNVYEALMASALPDSFNATPFDDIYGRSLKPLMRSSL